VSANYTDVSGNLALIPARGGSKRIPRKNIKPFLGKPIIGYSIEAALKSGLFASVVVSTDDEEIAEVARELGAEVPFMRPDELADDFTGIVPVVRHGVEAMVERGMDVTNVCCIFSTSPFVLPSDLVAGLGALKDAPTSFSITSFPYPIGRALQISANSRLEMICPENKEARSQDLPEAWHDAGQFYWATREFILSGRGFMDGEAAGVVLPRHRVQDIDNGEDWIRAEAMYRVLVDMKEL